MHPSGKTEPPLPFPNGVIRLIEPYCLNNVAKYRKASPIRRPQGLLDKGGSKLGVRKEQHRPAYAASTDKKPRRVKGGAQFVSVKTGLKIIRRAFVQRFFRLRK